MPATEIDDIFASKLNPPLAGSIPTSSKAKGKTKAVISPSEGASNVEKKSKKTKKKDNAASQKPSSRAESTEANDTTPVLTNAKRKRTEPETVLDPSLSVAPVKRVKTTGMKEPIHLGKARRKNVEEEDKFWDSRGSGPRRKTDEGFSIYKEDELGIKDEGGDTPLCPFDCDCCF